MLCVDKLDAIVDGMLRAARIPGAAVGVVRDDEVVFARAYGYRDLTEKLPVTPQTLYPIASTTKSFNATLLGLLVEDGLLAWDAPVRKYLPAFRLGDAKASAQVTIRDLVTMRTGLPRHDWVWIRNRLTRAQLADKVADLGLSAGFRERFQYNNLTPVVAAHAAEVMTGQSWEQLIRQRLLDPLGMHDTVFGIPTRGDVTVSYHENVHRELLPTSRIEHPALAPSGSRIHSSIKEMLAWVRFNLGKGEIDGCRLLTEAAMVQLHSPQVIVGVDASGPSLEAAYAMGWFTDTYNGHKRVSHTGFLDDINTDVSLFPRDGVGMVSFVNFGSVLPARLINQYVFDAMMGYESRQTVQEKLAQYEARIAENGRRLEAISRVPNTEPSQPLAEYVGVYVHPSYGPMQIECQRGELALRRGDLVLPLRHWHYDAWVAEPRDDFSIQGPHAFDCSSKILFESNADGQIAALTMALEPAVAPARFLRPPQQDA